jgi:hypothetical protein
MPSLAKPTSESRLDDKEIARRLRNLDSAYRTRWTSLILLGVLVCWVGPVFFTAIIWMMQYWAHGDATELRTTFIWCCAIGIPVLFVLEYVTRGMFYEAPDGASIDSMGGDSPANRAGAYMLMIEISLWGPRMVITGIKRLAGDGRFGNAARKAGAQIIGCLFQSEDGGLATAQIFTHCSVNDDLFADALAYLLYHDRVGVAKDGLRVWILSDARKQLSRR